MLIGREKELQILQEAYESEYSEFAVVYGRRRVGKTFLIREKFNYTFTFQHSGLANESTAAQLSAFRDSLIRSGLEVKRVPESWLDAFFMLEKLIVNAGEGKKIVFIDEIPWMAAASTQFVTALENFWNAFCSARKDVLLIICGSATSWIVKNVFRNHGGLYGRVTKRIHLSPFNLHECELYANSRNLAFSRYDLLLSYMVLGGIPYYWAGLKKGLSASQNIDALFFSQDGEFKGEFQQLYASLFKNPDVYIQVISALGQKKIGMTRSEIIEEIGVSSSGKLTRVLDDLEQSDFIRIYTIPGYKKNNSIYQLIDNFTLFYYKFMRENKENDPLFWTHNLHTPTMEAWMGLSFEQVCFAHIEQIKKSLGISGVATRTYSWNIKTDEIYGPGAQIDMLIDRADNVINLCEMKFSQDIYTIDKDYEQLLRHKISRFSEATKTRKAIHLTMVTTYGVAHNAYWNRVQKEVTAEDLFKE
jgi:AAA+ ATPase superfamily predicted ATPase